MDWRKATGTAAAIAAEWTSEGGPGGAILLFDTDDIRSESCGGLASLELAIPFTAETVIRYASISKHFLCSLLLRLNDERVMSLAATLGDYVPELPPAPASVPIARALDMTGGLPDTLQTLELLGVPSTASLDREALFAFTCRVGALNFQPGAEVAYSNPGYRLMEAALARKSMSYAALLRERFFRPLGLTIRFAQDEAEPIPGLATGYWRSNEEWRAARYGLNFSPSGGLAGTARDLVTWLQALMAECAPAEGLLPRLGARRALADGRMSGYGLGLARSRLGNEIAVGHGGSFPGYKTDFILLPERGAGVVVVSNREDTDAQSIALRVLAALTGAPLPEPAAGVLPRGVFVADEGPFWIEHEAGRLNFMGAEDRLVIAPDGAAVTLSAHFPVRLRYAGGAVEGEIGHVPRRFRPVTGDAEPTSQWNGEWVNAEHNARFMIADGMLVSGSGPLLRRLPLTPLDAHRALTFRQEGPSTQRACLVLQRDEIHLATYRSRVLRFRRA
jgi:CubicO group peptidase (beta-lactamase class C family)